MEQPVELPVELCRQVLWKEKKNALGAYIFVIKIYYMNFSNQ